MIACLHGHKNVVQLLLDQKNIDLNTKTNRGYTAFMWACENGHTSVVKLLLNHSESNIDLNATTNYFRFTAFILACKYGRKDVVKLLLDHSDRIELNAREVLMDRQHLCMLAYVDSKKLSKYFLTIQTQVLSLMQEMIMEELDLC